MLYPNRSRVSEIQFLIHVMINSTGFVQIVLNSWKILEMCPAIFQTWKNPKNGKKSWVYIFVKATTINESFFVLVKSYSISPRHLQCIMKEALFLYFLGSLLITFLITLSLGKEIQGYYYYCFGKVSGLKRWWILDPKICTNLNCSNSAYLKYDNQTSRSEKKEMINSWKRSWLLNKFLSSVLWEKYGRHAVMMMFGFEGLTYYIFHFTCWRHQLVKWRFWSAKFQLVTHRHCWLQSSNDLGEFKLDISKPLNYSVWENLSPGAHLVKVGVLQRS